MKIRQKIIVFIASFMNSWPPDGVGLLGSRLVLCLVLGVFILLQSSCFSVHAAAAGENSFDPRVVLDGLISTCGLVILVAGGALGVRMFFNGQMVQAVMAVLIAAFVFTLLNTAALRELGLGLKSFIWAGDSSIVSSSKP